jgi:hypothetical protein
MDSCRAEELEVALAWGYRCKCYHLYFTGDGGVLSVESRYTKHYFRTVLFNLSHEVAAGQTNLVCKLLLDYGKDQTWRKKILKKSFSSRG